MGFDDRDAFSRYFGEDPPRDTRLLLYGGREMTMRVTFKPWMFRRSLPHHLQGVHTRTLVVWGAHDRIIPLDSGQQYVEALPNARLVQIEDAGHFVDFERPDELAATILETRVGASA
jgi:pimeloyl-ACP methyl ester carboxylesterase